MECEKLAQEKTEMQRHYVMVSEYSLKHDIDKINELTWIMYSLTDVGWQTGVFIFNC